MWMIVGIGSRGSQSHHRQSGLRSDDDGVGVPGRDRGWNFVFVGEAYSLVSTVL